MGNLANLTTILASYTLNQIIINLLVAVMLGAAIAFVYKLTHKGVSYSQSFVISLVLIPLVTAAIIMIIGSNLVLAFIPIGAFSVIRFRTAVKDARDITFLFFSLVEGMAAGTANFKIAAASYLIFTATTFLLHRTNFGKFSGFEYLLSFHTDTKPKGQATHLQLFDKFLSDHMLLSLRSTSKPSEIIMAYNVRFNNSSEIKQFLVKLKATGARHIELISSQSDVDY